MSASSPTTALLLSCCRTETRWSFFFSDEHFSWALARSTTELRRLQDPGSRTSASARYAASQLRRLMSTSHRQTVASGGVNRVYTYRVTVTLFVPCLYLSAITVTEISQSFTYKMAAKINWRRYGTKLRDLMLTSSGWTTEHLSLGRVKLQPVGRHPRENFVSADRQTLLQCVNIYEYKGVFTARTELNWTPVLKPCIPNGPVHSRTNSSSSVEQIIICAVDEP